MPCHPLGGMTTVDSWRNHETPAGLPTTLVIEEDLPRPERTGTYASVSRSTSTSFEAAGCLELAHTVLFTASRPTLRPSGLRDPAAWPSQAPRKKRLGKYLDAHR